MGSESEYYVAYTGGRHMKTREREKKAMERRSLGEGGLEPPD